MATNRSDRDNKGRFTSSGAKKYGKLGGEASRDARKKRKQSKNTGAGSRFVGPDMSENDF
jgi:hypothetical protein